jgi:heme exporter protein A
LGREQLAAQTLELVDLKKQRNQIVRTLSRGMQQRLSIGRALLHDPQILFLDEPYTGLDQAMTGRMRALLKQLAESGKTIIMSSHSFQEVSAFGTRALFLHKGVIVDSVDLAGMDEDELAQRYRTVVQMGAQG